MKTLSYQIILLALLSSRLAAAQFFPLPVKDQPIIQATTQPQEAVIKPEDVTPPPQEAVETEEPLIRDTDNFILPACEMDCSNEGYCRLGIKDGVIDPTVQFCECLPGHFGGHCEHEASRCGEKYCYHGSECFDITLSDGSSEHLCDCAPAYTDETYYSGQFCQYPSTVFCTGRDDPNGRRFCTNGGSCPTEEPHACDCPQGFGGPRCDHTMSEAEILHTKCSLDCKHGGLCQKGSKDMKTEFGKWAEDVSHLWNETTRDLEHCICPEGFYGIACEYAIEQCAMEGHICFHGSTCVTDADEIGCDCEAAERNAAGLFCEFLATDECLQEPQDDDTHRGFCTNGGTCVVDEDSSLRCRCPIGFEGPLCEYRVVPSNSNFTSREEDAGLGEGAKLCILLSIFFAITVLVWYVVYHPRSEIEEEKVSKDEESDHASTEVDEEDVEHQVVDFDSEKIYAGGNTENSEIRII